MFLAYFCYEYPRSLRYRKLQIPILLPYQVPFSGFVLSVLINTERFVQLPHFQHPTNIQQPLKVIGAEFAENGQIPSYLSVPKKTYIYMHRWVK